MIKELSPELKKQLLEKKEALQKELDEDTFEVCSLELLELINNPHPLAAKFDKKNEKDNA